MSYTLLYSTWNIWDGHDDAQIIGESVEMSWYQQQMKRASGGQCVPSTVNQQTPCEAQPASKSTKKICTV